MANITTTTAAMTMRAITMSGKRRSVARPDSGDTQRTVVLLPNDERPSVSALYRLIAWLSPAYPVGAFSYSSGLEWAVEAGDVTNAEELRGWLSTMMTDGAGFCDAVFFAHAYRASKAKDEPTLLAVAELASALAPSRERFMETSAQGRAFLRATQAAWPCPALTRLAIICPDALVYPVAVAVACAGHHIPLQQALAAYLQALAANWVSAGVRLIPLGQTDGQHVIATIEAAVVATSERALAATLDEAGGAAFRADIAAMRHETQYTRLFRS